MERLLTIVSVFGLLIWGLVLSVGVAGISSSWGVSFGSLFALALAMAGVAATVWVGFFSGPKITAGEGVALQSMLVFGGFFTISGGLWLLTAAFGAGH